MEGQKEFVQIDPNDLFPYLLVNIGSGVSMIKVYLFSSSFYLSFWFHWCVFYDELVVIHYLNPTKHRLMGMENLRGSVGLMLVVVLIGAWAGC